MNVIARIASLELRGLFYSPVGWVVLVTFILSQGIFFTDELMTYQTSQFLGQPLPALTEMLFASRFGFFAHVQQYLFLYIPLLTMGLMSRELSSGSIKLLYSSPVKLSHIVLGKYLALVGFGLVLMLILAIYVLAANIAIASLDMQWVASGMLGLYLLICAYSAVGLFISCLTSYQLVSAVSTLMALAALQYIGKVWQQYDVFRDLTYFLSISGRTEEFIGGLISSKDTAYFLIVIALFLCLSIVKLHSSRASIRLAGQSAIYFSMIVVALGLGYLSSRPALWLFYDMTANKSRTPTAKTQELIRGMTSPLKMTTYVNLLDDNAFHGLPTSRNDDLRAFNELKRFKPDLKTRYVYYYDQSKSEYLYKDNPGLNNRDLAKRVAATWDIDFDAVLGPDEIRKKINLAPEENRLVRLLEYGGRKSFLRMFDDINRYPMESETAAALKRLVVPPLKVAFLTGHGERRIDRKADKDYYSAVRQLPYRYSLVNQGFEVALLNLTKRAVPDDVSVLVIADPKMPFTAQESAKIQRYLDSGDNALITAEPGSQEILNSLLEPLGVQLAAGRLLQKHVELEPDFILAKLADSAIKRSGLDAGLFDEQSKVAPIYVYGDDLFKVKTVSLPTTAGIRHQEGSTFTAHPVLVSDGANDAIPVAIGLTRLIRGKEQRLMIVGDSDFMSNQELSRENVASANLHFTMETFKWLSGGQFPIDANKPRTKDRTILVDKADMVVMKMVLLGVLPVLTVILGVTLLIRRRRL